jgi:hypothetical protein
MSQILQNILEFLMVRNKALLERSLSGKNALSSEQ